jgi:hypothetical protein
MVTYLPYKQWQKKVFGSSLNTTSSPLPLPLGRAIAISEIAARHHVFHINCLRRCLVQRRMLAQYGLVSTLHFGVAKEQNKMKAHCWLTYKGELINDGPEVIASYTELVLNQQQQASLVAGLK